MKRYNFKFTLFGIYKEVKLNAENSIKAREMLNAEVLKRLVITEQKVITDFGEKAIKDTDKLWTGFEDLFKNFGSLFGGKK